MLSLPLNRICSMVFLLPDFLPLLVCFPKAWLSLVATATKRWVRNCFPGSCNFIGKRGSHKSHRKGAGACGSTQLPSEFQLMALESMDSFQDLIWNKIKIHTFSARAPSTKFQLQPSLLKILKGCFDKQSEKWASQGVGEESTHSTWKKICSNQVSLMTNRPGVCGLYC